MTQMNISMKQNRLTDIENRYVAAKGEESGRGVDWEFGVSRCKLVNIEWTNNKVLLHSTGSYIHNPVKTIMEKNIEKNIYIYIHTHIYIYTYTHIYIYIYI